MEDFWRGFVYGGFVVTVVEVLAFVAIVAVIQYRDRRAIRDGIARIRVGEG
jgi:hypothetical protein